MEDLDNIMFFDTDDDFTSFCLCNNPHVYPNVIGGRTIYSYDYDFTADYNDAIAKGIKFKINDENSKVMKHGCVNKGVITKKVSNLAY